MTTKTVPCGGGNLGEIRIPKGHKNTITWRKQGTCTLEDLVFLDSGNNPIRTPACFDNRQPPSGGGDTISLDYVGLPIPEAGYTYLVTTTSPAMGNGTGTIRNT